MIGRKQNTDNRAWLAAVACIEQLIPRAELERLVTATLEDMQRVAAGKNAAFAWSGGKDSIVLAHLCGRVGIRQSMISISDLEYPAFVAWINEHHPDGCTFMNTGLDLEWLRDNPEALFPPMNYYRSQNALLRQQDRYYHGQRLDMMVFGRRVADGNFVGKQTNLYTDAKGRTKYNPIAYWSHEHILAYIHYYALPLPPIYRWADGYRIGTHPWFDRPYIDRDYPKGWAQIYAIDPSIVHGAAAYIESARRFLEGVAAG